MNRSAEAAAAFSTRAWAAVHELLSNVPIDQLSITELDQLAVASCLIGADDEAVAAWSAGYDRARAAGDGDEAARWAFWAAFNSMLRGQMAHAGGWLGRATDALDGDRDCPARGYLLLPRALGALDAGDPAAARELAVAAGGIAAKCGDEDLAALATLGEGQALLAAGEIASGLRRLDDVMLSVTAGTVGPIVTGVVYCAVVVACVELTDVARAREWTAALDAWCRGQPDLVPYRGQCLVHLSQLEQVAGEWASASSLVADARRRLTDPPHPALGLAYYQQGELHRLRGEVDAGFVAYRSAAAAGHEPLPGLALLDLQRGEIAAAAAAIRRALTVAGPAHRRPALLAAAVEIELGAGDLAAARLAWDELSSIAEAAGFAALEAMAAQAGGAVLLAAGAPADAIVELRKARSGWQELSMPYDAARAAALLARCCAELGDVASATIELDHAIATFEALGARPDLRRVDAMRKPASPGVLSARELDVLALIADGRTTAGVAEELMLSPHTVRRHVENIFIKLGVNSRAAAIARAYDDGLLA